MSGIQIAAALLCLVGGCQNLMLDRQSQVGVRADEQAALAPSLVRMKQAYSDLQSGRFVVLADFNTAPQVNLLRIVDSGGSDQTREQPEITVRTSRDNTGPGGLQATLRPGDRLLFDGVRSEYLALVRDWSPYALLLMSIHGPPEPLELRFGIRSQARDSREWSRTLTIQPGWNLIRLDLRDVEDAVDLQSIQALWWTAPGRTTDVTLGLDDLILCDNTRYVLGQQAGEGQLYAYTRGRRIIVGTPQRFELAFSDGFIVAWRAGDSANLAARDGLGPWALPLSEDWNTAEPASLSRRADAFFAAWGEPVDSTQRIVEATPFRVAIEGRRAYAPPRWRERESEDAKPSCSWRFVVYPSGRIYVLIRCDAQERGWPGAAVVHALDVRADPQVTHIPGRPAFSRRGRLSFVLLSRRGREAPDLLWAPAVIDAAARQRRVDRRGAGALRVLAGRIEPADTISTAHALWLWPHDLDGPPEAEAFAGDYQHPAFLHVSAGAARRDIPGDLNADGFNESEGCYELQLQDNLVRFRFEPGAWVRNGPIFRVHGSAQRRCWVYADGRIVEALGRDVADNLLFSLPGLVRESTNIEVVARSSSDRPLSAESEKAGR